MDDNLRPQVALICLSKQLAYLLPVISGCYHSLHLIAHVSLLQSILAAPENMKDNSQGPLNGRNGGSFKHYNTVAPKEEKVFPLLNNKGKTAIVTGAGAGIGLAVAQGLAESGANLAIWYHGNRKALDRAREIEEEYGVKCE